MALHSATAGAGQRAPDFELVDQHGTGFRLSEALEHGAVVLVFLRGFV